MDVDFRSYRPEWVDALPMPRVLPETIPPLMERIDGRRLVRPFQTTRPPEERQVYRDASCVGSGLQDFHEHRGQRKRRPCRSLPCGDGGAHDPTGWSVVDTGCPGLLRWHVACTGQACSRSCPTGGAIPRGVLSDDWAILRLYEPLIVAGVLRPQQLRRRLGGQSVLDAPSYPGRSTLSVRPVSSAFRFSTTTPIRMAAKSWRRERTWVLETPGADVRLVGVGSPPARGCIRRGVRLRLPEWRVGQRGRRGLRLSEFDQLGKDELALAPNRRPIQDWRQCFRATAARPDRASTRPASLVGQALSRARGLGREGESPRCGPSGRVADHPARVPQRGTRLSRPCIQRGGARPPVVATTPVAGGAHSDDAQPHDIHQAAALLMARPPGVGRVDRNPQPPGIRLDDARESRADVGTDRERVTSRTAHPYRPLLRRTPEPQLPASVHPPPRHAEAAGLDRPVRHPVCAAAVRADRPEHAQALLLRTPGRDRPVCAGLAVLAETLARRRGGDLHRGRADRASQQLFTTAAELDLVVAPMVEVGLDFFRFWQDFPFNLDELVRRAGWLLRNFGNEPNHLRVYDSQGQPRPVVWLIETIHVGPVTPQDFAAGFDRAAELLHEQTGHRPGWIIDPTPLPGYGSHDGPDPAALRTTPSVLAVNPFNITTQGPGAFKDQVLISEDERLAYARNIMTTWASSNSGIPFIAPILPGYDAHIVFPPPRTTIYGFNPDWRLRQQQRGRVRDRRPLRRHLERKHRGVRHPPDPGGRRHPSGVVARDRRRPS